uniref:Calcium-dependent protein kinase n=1 Tax=Dunaliella tertiolecta TaxID=3047 RepID=Q9SDM4_DUNTE|nr:calcium-dependent protein kinase [Dunaliella tertiolecta]|mmetsp:Transcript_16175/g.44204  ORF Transcript_16175/g.44204 Transcript_16175/m.44204 type:complete len:596 (-) Transcript_16175:803-2590(-)|eukprot:CAMPEP_0202353552 /NCGR_PEP_ID=MMETSP1126-20121109/9264_1 /ASSEMBLY_ACC=CAM_ASM_000457 /TAXON_ID=3047 /ORGANISM="Dunaliella tertiolecta, Strain CCMP1320" /LENGTH=595 /DNA_ID=CAMNT_0048945917 /DNA_START=131 /DNA_END=1918 /DNA_ORIENTATION=-
MASVDCTLVSARGIKDVEIVGKQSPYAVLTVGPKTFKSGTANGGGSDPVWNQTFSFTNVTPDSSVKLEIFNSNVVLRDVAIGGCKAPMDKALSAGKDELTLPIITKKGKPHGEVKLILTLKPDATKQMVTSHKTRKAAGAWILPTYGNTDCWKDYEPGTLLGKGTFGTTYLATEKKTGQKCAVKVISKRKLTTPDEVDDVKKEVQIMHHLAGHPNVVGLKGVYEDKSNVCLAMEVATGGELFDSIVKRGHYSERDAAELIRTIVSVVAHCHNMGVIHRDLKPENFLLSDKSPRAQLKATDFGLSSFFQEGQVFTDIVGSAYYVAPEVLRRSYGKEADIWSCGIILYILLCGFPPFHGDSEKKIFEAIISKSVDFNTQPWPRISAPAKDCVKRMLQRDPKKRATANEIMQHDWMRENGVASDEPLEMEVVSRIKNFSGMNKLKKEALKVIAVNLPIDEISGMREMFMDIDKDKSGNITIDEFAAALHKKGQIVTEKEIEKIMKEADVDGDGTIDYEEFLAATINLGKLQREENLKTAFEHFDLDGNGEISHNELVQCLSKLGINDAHVKDIIKEVDADGNGQIDYNEFCIMMRNLD